MVDYPPDLGPRPDLREPEPGPVEWRAVLWQVLVFGVVTLVVFCSVTSAITVLIVHSSQDDGQHLLDQVNSCTNPKGECYQRSQAQLAQTIDQIKANSRGATSAAAACAIFLLRHDRLPRDYVKAYQAISKCQRNTLTTPPVKTR
jgi:hypothetical protein